MFWGIERTPLDDKARKAKMKLQQNNVHIKYKHYNHNLINFTYHFEA